MIKLSNVNKSFEDKVVLKDFSLHVSAGERICLMGASGTGKTTILRLIMGLEKADNGEVYKGGAVSAVFQEDRLCEDFSALSNVALVCDDKEKAKEMLCALSLCDDLDTPVRDLSGGMKR
ncbi:MAG: ATP-binding cassette domain-containing protein, partial [Clostridia bacterium]|nr:ATP-binding cassette domain-containing protein [Clostridia bacterium]